jgi:hypothetical protein
MLIYVSMCTNEITVTLEATVLPTQKVNGPQKVGVANIRYVSFSDYKQLDNIAIVGDQMEADTNSRYSEDDNLGNLVLYLHTHKLDKCETDVYKLMHRKNRYN